MNENIEETDSNTDKMRRDKTTMGHTQARHFLKTFLKAMSTHDYESVEQLRRTLAIEHYRRAINRGEHISESEVVPDTGEVEKWLARLEREFGGLGPGIDKLLKELGD